MKNLALLAGILSVSALLCFILRYLHPATFTSATTAILTLAAALTTAGYIASQPHGN